MTAADKMLWEARIANPGGYLKINTTDLYYETGGDQYDRIRNDLLAGIVEYIRFPNPLGGETIVRAECIEALVYRPADAVLRDYEFALQEDVVN